MYTKKLDDELTNLLYEIDVNLDVIRNDSTVISDGVYKPNSAVAVETANWLLRVSEILQVFEESEE